MIRLKTMILLAVFSPAGILSAERGWTIAPYFGMHWGMAREIVNYVPAPKYPTENEYLSLLLWELKDVLMLGIDSRWENGNVLGLEFDLGVAIPYWFSGEMNDYDWYFTDRDWSHWSVSDIWLTWGIVADASIDFRILNTGPLSVHTGLSLHLDWWGWTDELKDNVYSQADPTVTYPAPFDESSNHVFRDQSWKSSYIGEPAIDFWFINSAILAAVKIHLQGRKRFAELSLRIGPALVYFYDLHKLRDLVFQDIGIGFPWIDGAGEVGVHLSKNFSLGLRFEVAWMNEIVTDTYYYSGSGIPLGSVENGGGFGFFRAGVNMFFMWKLPAIHPRSLPG